MTDVDICNVALSYLGDEANVSSINPPEGSAQADHCARFYPIAKRELLESFPWSFAMRTATLAKYEVPEGARYFDYAVPADCIRLVNVLRGPYVPVTHRPRGVQFLSMSDGNKRFIRTATPVATAVYVTNQVSESDFSGAFAEALSWLLASKLAATLQGGQGGAELARNCLVQSQVKAELAKVQDANQTNDRPLFRCGLTGDYQENYLE